MIVAESLCCGTPVVGFKAGAPEVIALSEYSRFVEHGDTDALETALLEMLEKKIDVSRELAVQSYSKEKMSNDYYRLYEGISYVALDNEL